MSGETASCFLHGDFDATLWRCPKCAARRVRRRGSECMGARDCPAETHREDCYAHERHVLRCPGKLCTRCDADGFCGHLFDSALRRAEGKP